MGDVVFGITVLVISAVIIIMTTRDMIEQWRQEDDAEFERKRADRQAEFDRHAKEVIGVELLEVCENAYIGNWRRKQ